MQIYPTFILEVCPKKAAYTELDFCKVMKILDQVHTLLKCIIKRCPTKPVRRQHVDKACFQTDHKYNASSIAVPSYNGKMTEKSGFTMRHKVRGVLQEDNSKLEKNSMVHL